MVIGERLRTLREERNLSQGDIEKRTGLLRCYISRVENGHTVPAVETLEKLARAMKIPMYQLFYEGTKPPKLPDLPKHGRDGESEWGNSRKDAKLLAQFRRVLARTTEKDQKLLLHTAQKMAGANRVKA
jgi:transcriptional regulator with XRE-family HTH domain